MTYQQAFDNWAESTGLDSTEVIKRYVVVAYFYADTIEEATSQFDTLLEARQKLTEFYNRREWLPFKKYKNIQLILPENKLLGSEQLFGAEMVETEDTDSLIELVLTTIQSAIEDSDA